MASSAGSHRDHQSDGPPARGETAPPASEQALAADAAPVTFPKSDEGHGGPVFEAEHRSITRGVNPVPTGGWPWHLTDYEVGYIREFGVRPVREGWAGTPEENHRLDQEAYGAQVNAATRAPQRRRYRLWVWVFVTSAIVAVGAVATTFAIINLSTAADLNRSTSHIEADL